MPSDSILDATSLEPGTSHTTTSSAFLLPATALAKALKSSILPFVHEPTNT